MFHARQIIHSALVAATIAAAAPVHADASFATGGYARFAPASSQAADARGTTIATPVPAFATGGYARVVAETAGTIVEPAPTFVTPGPSFATGGYARTLTSNTASTSAQKFAGEPWNGGVKGGYQGGYAPERDA